ncbi:MAG: 4-(cytidine 5'-diphospho)-2-C-methyl-D-erythritol kinase [Candidatus Tyrphobacter sp.]
MALRIRAPAKINLTLEVLGRRDDGFHGIRSVVAPLALADTVEIERADRLIFECDDAELNGEENLALRAVRALEKAANRTLKARIRLSKVIPTKAGLGGGSSDAAAMLLAAMEGCFGDLPSLDWLRIARSLGSDVPLFLANTAALVEGTGERVTAVGSIPQWPVLAVKPPAGISTAQAYEALDRRERAIRPRADSISLRCASALARRDFEAVQELLGNDFEATALEEPQIATAYRALEAAGARRPLLAGSGSCVFVLAPDEESADAIARRLDLPADFAVFRTALAASPAWRSEAAP